MGNKVSKTVILKDTRCSFVFITNPNKSGKFQVQPLVEKDSALHKKLDKLQLKLLREAFGEKAKPGKYKLPLRDGDDEREEEEYQGMMFFNANSGDAPGIVNRKGQPATEEDLKEMGYSGCYFHISCTWYNFDAQDGGKPGIAVGLNNVMLREPGPRLDGRKSAESEFSEFADESDDWDDDDDDDDI